VLLSAASAFTYMGCIGQGIAVGDLLGVRGHEADVAIAQRWATYWLVASACCLGASSVAAALALPIYADSSRLPRFLARLVLTSISSLILAAIIGFWLPGRVGNLDDKGHCYRLAVASARVETPTLERL